MWEPFYEKKKKEKHWHSLKRNYPESCQGTWKGSSCKISPSPEETTQWSPTHFPNELSLCCSLIIVDKNTTLQQACDEWSNTVIDAILEVPAVPEVFLLVSLCRIWVWEILTFNSETPPVIFMDFPKLDRAQIEMSVCFTDHSVGKFVWKKKFTFFSPLNSFCLYQILHKQNPRHHIPLKIFSPQSDLKFLLMPCHSCSNVLWRIKYLKCWSW